jgi:hypothetical protein
MKKIYQIFNNWEENQAEILKAHGIEISLGFQNITLEEQEFKKIEPLFNKWGAMVSVGSEFSSDDLSKASCYMVLPAWQTLYPQPENNFQYMQETYDLSKYCNNCGIGAIQKNPFRIKKEIKWGKRSSFILNWVFDEIFVSQDTYEKVFLPNGLEYVPVLLYKSDKVVENIVQLKINKAVEKLNLERMDFTECSECKQKKYNPIAYGYFPGFYNKNNEFNLLKSQEYYGSGKSASNWIIASKSFRNVLIKEKVNFTYHPSAE